MGSTGDERFGRGFHRNQAFGSGPTGKGLPKNGVTSDSGRIRARSQTLNPKYIPSYMGLQNSKISVPMHPGLGLHRTRAHPLGLRNWRLWI